MVSVSLSCYIERSASIDTDARDQRRLWVLQEAVLAQSSICYLGNCEFSLIDVVHAARWLLYKFRFISQGIYDCAGWRCAAEMFDFLDPEHGISLKRQVLAGMLEIPQRFEKTEPKDSIYGILGLIDRIEDESEDQATLLHVEYTKSLAAILRDATRYALHQTANLSVLRQLYHSNNELDGSTFPSWAIQAHIQRQSGDLQWLPNFFSASKGLPLPSSLLDRSRGSDILLLQGITADHVSETTITCEGEDWHGYEGFDGWLRSAKALLHGIRDSSVYGDAHQTHLAMGFALTAGEAYNRKRAVAEDISTLTKYIDEMPMRRDSLLDGSTTYSEAKMDAMYAVSRVTFCMRRRFFITRGSRVGLGPNSMRPGDRVMVFRGGHTPFVIREIDDEYQLVGACYVHGIMDGEAVSSQTSIETFREEVFCIR